MKITCSINILFLVIVLFFSGCSEKTADSVEKNNSPIGQPQKSSNSVPEKVVTPPISSKPVLDEQYSKIIKEFKSKKDDPKIGIKIADEKWIRNKFKTSSKLQRPVKGAELQVGSHVVSYSFEDSSGNVLKDKECTFTVEVKQRAHPVNITSAGRSGWCGG